MSQGTQFGSVPPTTERQTGSTPGSGNFFNTTTINCDNPLLSAQQRAIVCSPANLVERRRRCRGPDVFLDPTTGNPV